MDYLIHIQLVLVLFIISPIIVDFVVQMVGLPIHHVRVGILATRSLRRFLDSLFCEPLSHVLFFSSFCLIYPVIRSHRAKTTGGSMLVFMFLKPVWFAFRRHESEA